MHNLIFYLYYLLQIVPGILYIFSVHTSLHTFTSLMCTTDFFSSTHDNHSLLTALSKIQIDPKKKLHYASRALFQLTFLFSPR